jgi:phenylacetate-CoA ligase
MSNLLNVGLHISRMKLNQWKDESEIRALQEQKLLKLISYVSKHVPFYRKLLKGITIRSLEELAKIPVLQKSDIRGNPNSFLSECKARPYSKLTSGSTGVPMRMHFDKSDAEYQLALEYFQLTEAGVMPHHKQAQITYYQIAPSLLQKAGIFRRHYLSDTSSEQENLKLLKRMGPDVLHTAPSFFVPLAHENLVRETGFQVKKAFSFAEVLTPNARKITEKSFGCDLRDLYGSTETSWAAWECENGNMHLNSDSVIAEIVDENLQPVKPGKSGTLLLTPLWKRTMPFIRYFMSDKTAIKGKCPCGRSGLQMIAPVAGRSDDFIVLPSGKFRSALLVEERVRTMPQILQYQAVQETPGQICINVILSAPLSPDDEKRLAGSISKAYGEDLDIEFEAVDSLPRGKTGKIRAVISKVKPDLSV